MSSLSILDINSFSDIRFANILSQCASCLFICGFFPLLGRSFLVWHHPTCWFLSRCLCGCSGWGLSVPPSLTTPKLVPPLPWVDLFLQTLLVHVTMCVCYLLGLFEPTWMQVDFCWQCDSLLFLQSPHWLQSSVFTSKQGPFIYEGCILPVLSEIRCLGSAHHPRRCPSSFCPVLAPLPYVYFQSLYFILIS